MGEGRTAISRRAALALAAAPLAALAGCSAPAPPARVAVELSDLPEGRRLRVLRGEEPVELLRRGGEVRALSLWCPHLGCELGWDEASRRYLCPCHDGVFDAEGRLVAGAPAGPMRAVPFDIVGARVVLAPRA